MTCVDDIVVRWLESLTAGGSYRKSLDLRSVKVFGRGDCLYSYGTHFALAHALRDRRGNVAGILLNGDRYSNTTARHQSATRDRVRTYCAAHGIPFAIIPFAALDAGGVVNGPRGTYAVEILESLPERYESRTHVSAELPDGAGRAVVPVWESVPLSDDEIATALDAQYAADMAAYRETLARIADGRSWHRTPPEEPCRDDYAGADSPAGQRLWIWWQRADGRPTERRQTGTTVRYGFGMRRAAKRYGPEDSGVRFSGPEITYADGAFTWTTHRHWLGESVIRARVAWRKRVPCRACRGTGRAIGPERPAVFIGAPVVRYDGGAPESWSGRLERRPARPPACPECEGYGYDDRHGTRPVTMLSGFDHNESRPCYFLCELPRSANRTVRDVAGAYESLKPEAVRIAESVGREYRRQGDIFAIPVPTVSTRDLTRAGGRRVRGAYILGTNHVATESIVTPDGATFVRGCLTHMPAGRRADHARIKLDDGRTWHVAVKNTVPVGR